MDVCTIYEDDDGRVYLPADTDINVDEVNGK